MLTNPISPGSLKLMLEELCNPEERDFSILYSRRKTRRRRGTYFSKRKLIILYLHKFKDHLDYIATALHELAHHVTAQRYGKAPKHGKEFRSSLIKITDNFNRRYESRLNGRFTVTEHLSFDSLIFVRLGEITPPGE